jgi:cyclopropane fatty-acyl-phospholipid synthase-like methyltransferase
MNKEVFLETFSHYEDKILHDFDKWVHEAATRSIVHGFDKLPDNASVCDLGCGGGYFMLACQQLGLRTLGVDLDRDKMYNEMIAYHKLRRVIHKIEPFQSMPELPSAPFHAITAFMTCFNRDSNGSPWTAEPWSYFVNDLSSQLVDGGRLIIKFNRNNKTHSPYPPSLRQMVKEQPGYRGALYSDVVELKKI